MKNRINFFVILMALSITTLFAQGTAINTSGTEADASAILDVSSTSQGMLLPRMTAAQRLAISSPTTGLIIFQTDGTTGFYYFGGTYWTHILSEVVGLASLTTTAASSITSTTASSGGNITDDGGTSITARGICWSTSSNPTTADSKTSDGTGTGSFTSSITGLTHSTLYYVRAYATNDEGTTYGDEISFTTSDIEPVLSTTSASDITSTTASSGGNITDNGGQSVTAKGVCWSTSQNPTTADSKTNDGTGTGSFTSSITGLTLGVTYYVRAYATNSVGTAYGDQISFTTELAIGDSYLGGIVFYLDGSGGGLIAAESDQSSGVTWDDGGNTNTSVGSTSSSIGTGAANTSTIVSYFGSGSYAAKICDDLSLNGYNDWYLPSASELQELKNNKTAVGGLSGIYWSSTQSSVNHKAGSMNMSGSFPYYYDTDTSHKVRAIRSF